MKGTIKKLVTEKNFGFISPEDGSKDIFFHKSQLVDVTFPELNEGDAVEFESQTDPNKPGPHAVNVKRA